jgi:hypothetical protein
MPGGRTAGLGYCGGCRLRQRPQTGPVGYAIDPDRRCRWRRRQAARPVDGVGDRSCGTPAQPLAGRVPQPLGRHRGEARRRY